MTQARRAGQGKRTGWRLAARFRSNHKSRPLSELELRQLRYRDRRAKGSDDRAARRLQLAQPALSQAIARLESQVGVRLLGRGPRGVTVTPAGEAFLQKAQATLAAWKR